MCSEEALRKLATKRTLLFVITKRQAKFLQHIMRKAGVEKLSLTRHTEINLP